jgi:hypothetical protein
MVQVQTRSVDRQLQKISNVPRTLPEYTIFVPFGGNVQEDWKVVATVLQMKSNIDINIVKTSGCMLRGMDTG